MGEKDKMLDDCQQSQDASEFLTESKRDFSLDKVYLSFMQSKENFLDWFTGKDIQNYFQTKGRVKRFSKEEIRGIEAETGYISDGAKINLSERNEAGYFTTTGVETFMPDFLPPKTGDRGYCPNPTAEEFWQQTRREQLAKEHLHPYDRYSFPELGRKFHSFDSHGNVWFDDVKWVLNKTIEQSILHRVRILVKYTPNDQELGARVRKLLNNIA